MKTIPFPSFQRLWFPAAALLLAFAVSGAHAGTPTNPAAFSVHVSGHGTPVLLIPGLGCSGEVWAETVKSLESSHECHVFTLAGFGGQPPVAGEFLSTMEQALGDYPTAHASPKPAIVGHSLGGLLAIKLSAKFPDLVSRVIIVDSLPFLSGAQPGATPEGARHYAAGLRAAMEQQSHEVFSTGIRQGLPRLVTTPAAQGIVFSWMQASDQATVVHALSDIIATDARADISHITCPVLLVEAGADPGAVPVELFAQQYSSARLLTRVRISDAQHFVMLDQPARFTNELNTFLAPAP